jgi:hypothetical protein
MSFSNAITDFVRSIYEAIAGTFHLIFGIIHGAFATVAHFFEACFTFVVDLVHNTVALVGGVGKFVFGNFVILAILAVGAYFYFQQNPQQKAKVQSTGQKAINSAQANGNRAAAKSKKAE